MSEDERDYEKEARAMGWVPQEEWRGDPDKWRDKKEFVEFGDNIMPILRSNNKMLIDKQTKSDARIAQLEQVLREYSEHNKKIEERAYERAKKEYEAGREQIMAEQKKAASEGDISKYHELETQKEKLESTKPEKPEETSTAIPPEVEEWRQENPWYDEDQELQAAANIIGQAYRQVHPRMATKNVLKYMKQQIEKLYPEKFENPNRSDTTDVGSSDNTGNSGKKSGKKTYADLPEEAKKWCDRFMAEKLYDNKQQYVDEYFALEA